MKSELFRALRKEMRNRDVTQADLSDAVYLCQMSLSNRFTAKTPWRMDEAYATLDYLDIPHNQIAYYFPKGGVSIDTARK